MPPPPSSPLGPGNASSQYGPGGFVSGIDIAISRQISAIIGLKWYWGSKGAHLNDHTPTVKYGTPRIVTWRVLAFEHDLYDVVNRYIMRLNYKEQWITTMNSGMMIVHLKGVRDDED